MNAVVLAVGVALLLGAVGDVLWATLWADGKGGPISIAVTTPLYVAMRRIARHRPKVMSLTGPMALVSTVLVWVLLLWGGWVLVFSTDTGSLTDVSGGGVSLAGRIYFVGYTMFTMGNGDFSPTSDVWQLATAISAASGMFIVTLVVTYLLSIVRAVAAKRAFASSVSGLGPTAEQIVIDGWDRGDLRSLDLPLQDLASRLSSIADQHNAFPVLHHFHTARRRQAPTVAVATLDDAVALLDGAVATDGPSRPVVNELRASIDDYLQTLQAAFILDRPVPDPPDIDAVGAVGMPTVDANEWRRFVDGRSERRRQLRGLVEGDGWPWEPQQGQ